MVFWTATWGGKIGRNHASLGSDDGAAASFQVIQNASGAGRLNNTFSTNDCMLEEFFGGDKSVEVVAIDDVGAAVGKNSSAKSFGILTVTHLLHETVGTNDDEKTYPCAVSNGLLKLIMII